MRKARKPVSRTRSRKATPRSTAKRTRCLAKTKNGKQCKRYTDGRSKNCSVHKK